MSDFPIAVDLDGTLVHTDMLHESLLAMLRNHPARVLSTPYWLSRGKAYFKKQVADFADFDPGSLPYNEELLQWLKLQKQQGRKLILCTASDRSVAQRIADHLDIFDQVFASDGDTNLSGKQKAKLLVQHYGDRGFDYVGNAHVDLQVWQHANAAILINCDGRLSRQVHQAHHVTAEFNCKKPVWPVIAKALRVHQWAKNLLLFMPILASHQVADSTAWLLLIMAFLAFSFTASGVYLLNDLLDLENDRRHLRKRLRPFASGRLSIIVGVLLAPLMVIAGVMLAYLVGHLFFLVLLFYFITTTLYSWWLKQFIILDCLVLAMLYTLRIIAGTVAVSLDISFWMLAFSIFLFMSLAYVKRYAELQEQDGNSDKRLYGRGYYPGDASLVQMLGIVSGYLSVLVLALYINSDVVIRLYQIPELVWAAVPVMLFWISWIWLKAHRGEMHDDPVVFAIKDKVSLLSGVLFAIVVLIASVGLA